VEYIGGRKQGVWYLDTLQDATHSSLPSSHRERREEYFQKKKKKPKKK